IGPVTALEGTTAMIWVGDRTETCEALAPPNDTPVTLAKAVPEIVTWVPTWPLGGVKSRTVGGTTKKLVVATIPAGVMRLIESVVASSGTIAVTRLLERFS